MPQTHYRSPSPAARSLGARMLAGQGDMTLTAIRDSSLPQIQVTSHRVTKANELVVTCRADQVPAMSPMEIRMDIVLLAPEFRAYAVSASVHALGTVHWIGTGKDNLLGIVQVPAVHVHYFAGAETFATRSLINAARSLPITAVQRFESAEIAHAFGQQELGKIIDAASLGILEGACAPINRPRHCNHFANEVFLADISNTGITLIRALNGSQTAVHVHFEESADTYTDLTTRISELVATSSVRRTAPRT